jgi:hypothetical protein
VPGHEGRCQPSDKDTWTQAADLANWTEELGTISAPAVSPKVGTSNICVVAEDVAGTNYTKIRRTVNIETYGDGAYQTLNFYGQIIFGIPTLKKVRLYAPNNANYFQSDISAGAPWTWNQIQLGQNQEYNVDTNPTGPWTTSGTPNWTTITEICFYTEGPGAPSSQTMYYDGLYFGHGRFRNTATNPASVTAYEQRDMQVTDDSLLSDAECATRAETLLYQLKDPPIRIDFETDGNPNIKIGDQLTMTIPAESISAAPYDVLTVTHDFTKDNFKTSASLVNSSLVAANINIRALPIAVLGESIERRFEIQSQISKGLRLIR